MTMAATKGYLNATELADYLARKGMPVSRSTRHGGPCGNVAIDRGVE